MEKPKQTASRVTVVSMWNVKHRIRAAVVVLLIALFFAGCSQSTTEQYDVDSTGEFYSVGNLPVNQIVYRDNGGQYVVDKCYQNCIGFLMHVQGNFDGDTMYGKHLNIAYAEVNYGSKNIIECSGFF